MAKRNTTHSAATGRFVPTSKAASSPKTTVTITSGSKPTSAARSAVTGRFVTDAYAARHPSTTVDGK